MSSEERRAAAIERATTQLFVEIGSQATAEIAAAVLDASGLLDESYECQFSDSAMAYHTPFSERAPICWSCFNAALDED